MAKIKPVPIIDYLTTEEYAEGRHAYKELGPGADCPYPTNCTTGQRYRWWLGYLEERASKLKVFQKKSEQTVQDTE